MKHEKTQKGNPHNLTVNQHAFPKKSIKRFTNNSGRIETRLEHNSKTLSLKPIDQLFCAKRVWDQRAESGFMKDIEDKYQVLANAIVEKGQVKIGPLEDQVITAMFALWNIRALRKQHPIEDHNLNGIIGLAREYTKDDMERLEKEHTSFIRPDFSVPGRFTTGINIQMNIDMVREDMKYIEWGILTAAEGEFIVPDNFSNANILPLSPVSCLCAQSKNKVIGFFEVARINSLARQDAREYWFARDINKSPFLS